MQAKQQARSCHLFALRLTRPLAVALALQQASGPWAEAEAMATAILDCAADPDRARGQGHAGKRRVEGEFSMGAMTAAYQGLYDRLLAGTGRSAAAATH
jgi:glycosyltransferase involved in cell wall biosynthesis